MNLITSVVNKHLNCFRCYTDKTVSEDDSTRCPAEVINSFNYPTIASSSFKTWSTIDFAKKYQSQNQTLQQNSINFEIYQFIKNLFAMYHNDGAIVFLPRITFMPNAEQSSID